MAGLDFTIDDAEREKAEFFSLRQGFDRQAATRTADGGPPSPLFAWF